MTDTQQDPRTNTIVALDVCDQTSASTTAQHGVLRRAGRRGILGGLVPILLLTLGLTTTSASALQYDGTDPYQTGCAASSHAVTSKSVAGGTLYLMWSTACKTNWAQYSSSGAGWISVWVFRGSTACGDQSGNGCGSTWRWNSAYSNQLYGCNYTSYAEVEIYNNGHPYYATTNTVGGC